MENPENILCPFCGCNHFYTAEISVNSLPPVSRASCSNCHAVGPIPGSMFAFSSRSEGELPQEEELPFGEHEGCPEEDYLVLVADAEAIETKSGA